MHFCCRAYSKAVHSDMMDQRLCMLKLLFLTGVRCMNIETERAWHARQLVSELTLHEMNSYDGIVAVIMLPAV